MDAILDLTLQEDEFVDREIRYQVPGTRYPARVPEYSIILRMKFFHPQNFFFNSREQFQKLLAFLIPMFGNVDGFVACHE